MEIKNALQALGLANVIRDEANQGLPLIIQQTNIAGDIVVFTKDGGHGGKSFRLLANGNPVIER